MMNSNQKTLPVPGGLVVDAPASDTPARRFALHRGFFNWLRKLNWLFICTVLAPTGLAIFYYGFVASDVYVSESSFIVQSVQDMEQQSSSIGSFLKSASSGSSDDDTASVQVYMQSRDALVELEKEADIRKAFTNPAIDRFSRFNGLGVDGSFESLYRYYAKSYIKKIVTIEPSETSSSISDLEVRAFTPQEAQLINRDLLEMGEKLVNALNDRLQKDLVHFAEEEVSTAEKSAETAYVALADFRNHNVVVDPDSQAKMQLSLVLALQQKYLDTLNQISQLHASSPNNPQITALENYAKSLDEEMKTEMSKASGDTGSSLSNKASEYERLVFERDFSQKSLGEAQAFLEHTRNQAASKLLYLKRIVEPNLPDVAIEPRRLVNVATVFVLGLVVWGITALFTAGVREHQQ